MIFYSFNSACSCEEERLRNTEKDLPKRGISGWITKEEQCKQKEKDCGDNALA